jgi:hypothetical protein
MTDKEPSSRVLQGEAICHLLSGICHPEDLTLLAGHSLGLVRESVRYSGNGGTLSVRPLLHLPFHIVPEAATERITRKDTDAMSTTTNPSSSHAQTPGLGTSIRASGASRSGLAPENGTTTRFGFRAGLRTGSRTRGMVCWLQPA